MYKLVSVEISNVPLFPPLGSSEILQQEPSNILYPKILGNESIDCDCGNIACDSVYWFRSVSHHSKLQFLGTCNNADRVTHGAGVEEARFKLTRKRLQIINVTEEDAGVYSCVLKDRKNTIEMWKSGTLLRPGGLYAEISSNLFTALKYQAAVRVSVYLSVKYLGLNP